MQFIRNRRPGLGLIAFGLAAVAFWGFQVMRGEFYYYSRGEEAGWYPTWALMLFGIFFIVSGIVGEKKE
jgi:hypothetical protein